MIDETMAAGAKRRVEEWVRSDDASIRLDQLQALRDAVTDITIDVVIAARKAGLTWKHIDDTLDGMRTPTAMRHYIDEQAYRRDEQAYRNRP